MRLPRLTIAQSASDMDRLRPLWAELLRDQSCTIFQHFSWNRLAAEMFAERATPCVIAVESESGAAIIPAAMNHASGQMELLGERLFDYRDILHAGDRGVLSVAWERLAAYGNPLAIVAIDETARGRWTDFPLTDFAQAPEVDPRLADEHAFRLAHSRLGRQLRRLSRQSIHMKQYSGKHSDLIRHLYQCKREHFAADVDNIFLDQQRCEFMIAVAALEGSACDAFTLENETGTLVAGLITFRDGNVRRFYTIYFHPGWARYSPGIALLYEATARSLGEGLTCDYMTGQYSYKMRLANSSRPLYQTSLTSQQLAELAERAKFRSAA